MDRKIKGQIISGKFDDLLIRIKSDSNMDLGEILVCESEDYLGFYTDFLQIFDIEYSSQISKLNLELASGIFLERSSEVQFLDNNLRNYKIAHAKMLFRIRNNHFEIPKSLPDFFTNVYEIEKDDMTIFSMPNDSIYLGNIRSGRKIIDVDIGVEIKNLLSEHVLVCSSTGKGKSNLTSCILFDALGKDCSFLVLDPHDEYYGRDNIGLKDHPLSKDKLSYYTIKDVPIGQNTLKINLKSIKPMHLSGSINLSEPQNQLMYMYFKEYEDSWIEALMMSKPLLNGDSFNEATINVLRRKLQHLFNVSVSKNGKDLISSSIFCTEGGENTVDEIIHLLENSKIVIVDTSSLSGSAEILLGSIITYETFNKYKFFKSKGILSNKPNISVVLEEAPRVLGKDILESGSNIFETLAREGRKFKIGIFAITQLPSLIPKPILANLNTKILLGLEMSNERQAVIDSASQDLTKDSRTIASLDKGEAIISSTFLKFAVPVKIPKFHDYVTKIRSEFNKNKKNIELNL